MRRLGAAIVNPTPTIEKILFHLQTMYEVKSINDG